MGEYYNWINVDKREYFHPSDFGYGSKYLESMHKESEPLLALHCLLNDEWKGDHILWFGDERSVLKQSSNSVIQTLYAQSVEFGYPEDAFDMICESYRNVSCLFKEAEEEVRTYINMDLADYKKEGKLDHFNEYGIDFENPFEGMFLKTGRRFEFTINHSKKIYYSLNETDILFPDHTKNVYSDPLPSLMGYGRVAGEGKWLGDIIGVSDQRPEGYALIRGIVLDL